MCCLFHRVDPFSKKDWYDVKAPSMFNIRQIGKTLVTRTIGTSTVIFEASLNFPLRFDYRCL